MKRLLLLFCSVVLFCNLLYGQEKIKIAVLDFPATRGMINKEDALSLTNELARELEKVDKFEVLSGVILHNKAKELKLSLKNSTPNKLKTMGEALYVDYILIGEILQVNIEKDVETYSTMKRGDSTYRFKVSGGVRNVFLDEYVINYYIIDGKDGSCKYLVKTLMQGKNFSEGIGDISSKIKNKILTKPIDVIKISNVLYVYPEDLGPIGIIDGYKICDELNLKKMYGYDDWRPPTIDELEVVIRYLNSVKKLQASTYILDKSNKFYDVPKRKWEGLKYHKGTDIQSYKNKSNEYGVIGGRHYLRLVRGGIPED